MLTYVIPTRNRPDTLAATLDALAQLGPHDAEVLILDNASDTPARAQSTLASGLRCHVVRLPENIGAAARNLAITHAHRASQWLVMLDDDSAPLDLGHLAALREADASAAIVAAEIFLPSAPGAPFRHESGGLPEVFVGCGVAIRTDFFRAQRGYDPTFDYYAEEYDLAARALLDGFKVALDRRFRVLHRKVTQGRDMGRILARLVRNNAWVSLRYAPDNLRLNATLEHIQRYARIAHKEHALRGYATGLLHLASTLNDQPRRPMPHALWDRFTGMAAARNAVDAMIQHSIQTRGRAPRSVALIAQGKNAHIIHAALTARGIAVANDIHATHATHTAEAHMIGTLSPGPLLDALREHAASINTPLYTPWLIEEPAAAPHANAA